MFIAAMQKKSRGAKLQNLISIKNGAEALSKQHAKLLTRLDCAGDRGISDANEVCELRDFPWEFLIGKVCSYQASIRNNCDRALPL